MHICDTAKSFCRSAPQCIPPLHPLCLPVRNTLSLQSLENAAKSPMVNSGLGLPELPDRQNARLAVIQRVRRPHSERFHAELLRHAHLEPQRLWVVVPHLPPAGLVGRVDQERRLRFVVPPRRPRRVRQQLLYPPVSQLVVVLPQLRLGMLVHEDRARREGCTYQRQAPLGQSVHVPVPAS